MCAARFGDDSVCHRGLCATDCFLQSDCDEDQVCNGNGICVVGGPEVTVRAPIQDPPNVGVGGVPFGNPTPGPIPSPNDQFPPPRMTESKVGDACQQEMDCGVDHCCPQASSPGRLCQVDPCVPAEIGSPCGSPAYCASGRCIENMCAPPPLAEGEACQSDAYCATGRCIDDACAPPPLAEGAACAGDAYCASQRCIESVCGPAPAADGAACTVDGDCVSAHCCPDGATGMRACRVSCSTLIGDYCMSDSDCPSGAFCQGDSNFADDGYCSTACSNGCGYDSRGVANRCIQRTQGSIPASVCKPGCETNGECWEIHPDLSCWETATEYACDFDINTWASAF